MDTTLLTLGVALLLVGLIGQVKAKEIEIGTQNGTVRLILGLIGLAFIFIALYPTITSTFTATPTSTPTLVEVPPATTIAPSVTVPPPAVPTVDTNLLAQYTLNGTDVDMTGNNPRIDIGGGVYSEGGVYCDGVEYNCLLTPPIYDLNYQNFSISAEFKVVEYPSYPMPVFVGGRSWRWAGFELASDGGVQILYNNMNTVTCQGVYGLNTWHTAMVTYDGSVGRLYLDNQLRCSESFAIEAGGGSEDKNVSSSNYSNAAAFKGFIRNLKIYRTAIVP